jgi:hypothetical protein
MLTSCATLIFFGFKAWIVVVGFLTIAFLALNEK